MNQIALVSANFGGNDKVKSLPRHDGIDAFYFCDEATRDEASAEDLATWTRVIVPNYPRHDFDARLRSRYFKHQIHRIDEVRTHRWLVWVDASIRLFETDFIVEWTRRLAERPPNERVLLVPHPQRGTISEEYEFIKSEIARGEPGLSERYSREKMTEQMTYFAERGYDLSAKVFCGGFWMIENSDLLRSCWNDWWDQNLRFGMMDQLSLPVMLDQHGCRAQSLEVLIWKNVHFQFIFRNGIPGLQL